MVTVVQRFVVTTVSLVVGFARFEELFAARRAEHGTGVFGSVPAEVQVVTQRGRGTDGRGRRPVAQQQLIDVFTLRPSLVQRILDVVLLPAERVLLLEQFDVRQRRLHRRVPVVDLLPVSSDRRVVVVIVGPRRGARNLPHDTGQALDGVRRV